MVNDRYISTLLSLTDKQIIQGSNEIKRKYKDSLNFKDRLICFVLKND